MPYSHSRRRCNAQKENHKEEKKTERRKTYTSTTCYIVVYSMGYEHNNISYLQQRFTPLHRSNTLCGYKTVRVTERILAFSSDSTCQRSTVKIAIAFSSDVTMEQIERERKKGK